MAQPARSHRCIQLDNRRAEVLRRCAELMHQRTFGLQPPRHVRPPQCAISDAHDVKMQIPMEAVQAF